MRFFALESATLPLLPCRVLLGRDCIFGPLRVGAWGFALRCLATPVERHAQVASVCFADGVFYRNIASRREMISQTKIEVGRVL